jgi:hypothetical protein
MTTSAPAAVRSPRSARLPASRPRDLPSRHRGGRVRPGRRPDDGHVPDLPIAILGSNAPRIRRRTIAFNEVSAGNGMQVIKARSGRRGRTPSPGGSWEPCTVSPCDHVLNFGDGISAAPWLSTNGTVTATGRTRVGSRNLGGPVSEYRRTAQRAGRSRSAGRREFWHGTARTARSATESLDHTVETRRRG